MDLVNSFKRFHFNVHFRCVLASSNYSIRKCYPTIGDWYEIQLGYENDLVRVWMSRVILWAHVTAPKEIERIEAIDNQGHIHSSAHDGDVYYVRGSDYSPTGETWDAIFASIPASPLGVHELSSDQAKFFQK